MDVLHEALTQLAKNSPYALIVVCFMLFFAFIHSRSLKQINLIFKASMENLTKVINSMTPSNSDLKLNYHEVPDPLKKSNSGSKSKEKKK